jgi:hypothetical protein
MLQMLGLAAPKKRIVFNFITAHSKGFCFENNVSHRLCIFMKSDKNCPIFILHRQYNETFRTILKT